MTLLASPAAAAWILAWMLRVASGPPLRVTTVTVGGNPGDLAVSPSTHEIFVVDGSVSGGALTILDGTRRHVGRLSPISTALSPFAPFAGWVNVDPMRNRAYVLIDASESTFIGPFGHGSITRLDRNTGERVETSVGWANGKPVINSVTNRVYVSNASFYKTFIAQITVLDGVTLATHAIQTGFNPFVAVDEVHNRIYVANSGEVFFPSDTVSVINGDTEATTWVVVGTGPFRVVADPLRNRAWVANFQGPPGVSVIDADTAPVFTVIPVPLDKSSTPSALAINSITNKVFVALRDSPALVEIDGGTLQQTRIPIPGSTASNLAVDPVHNVIYALEPGPDWMSAGTLTVVDGDSLATQSVPVGRGATVIAVDAERDTAYVCNSTDGTLTVIEGPEAPCFRCPRVIPFRPQQPAGSAEHASPPRR